jgi:hypothetical protein
MTFKHSGDLGDIIYALPAIRALGGGVLMLDPEGGRNEPLCDDKIRKGTHLDAARIELLRPLLMRQPYIRDVVLWSGQPFDHNLDEFRRYVGDGCENLADSHLVAFGLPSSERDRPWLDVGDPITIPDRRIVIHRSVRHQGNFGFWYTNAQQLVDRAVFVGVPKEHEIFEYTFEVKIPYHHTADFLELARVIAGAEHFVGNASFPHALAQAMHHPRITLEFNRMGCNVIFRRPGVRFV